MFRFLTLIGLLAAAALPPVVVVDAAVTWDTFLEVQDMVVTTIEATVNTTEFPITAGPIPLARKIVRMAFHDAAGDGGVDAILDWNDPHGEHNGLRHSYSIVEGVWNEYSLKHTNVPISKADFFAWTYIIAIEMSAANGPGQPANPIIPQVPLRYGRYDVTPGHTPEEFFPQNTGGGQSTGSELFDYFDKEFAFTKRQTVALMGAHGLGGADPDNSGFSGLWTVRVSLLDNEFFQRIIGNAVEFATCAEEGGLDATGLPTCKNDDFTQSSLTACKQHENGCWNIGNGLAFKCGATTETADDWRCGGWEQVPVFRNPNHQSQNWKFEWRHGCRKDGSLCRGLMLNSDIGMYIDLDIPLCTQQDVDQTSADSAYTEGCKSTGQVSPDRNMCTGDRVFASCFAPLLIEPDSGAEAVKAFNDDYAAWMDEFEDVYDLMLLHQFPKDQLQELARVAPTARGDECPSECYDDSTVFPITCLRCETGGCQESRRRGPICANI